MKLDHRLYFREALIQASFSPDPSTQTGAVIIDSSNGNIVGAGCNEFPLGVHYSQERLERPLKYSFIEHAERNAVYDMAVNAESLPEGDLFMYALWAACADCARAIIQAGITTVYTHSFYAGGADASSENRKDWDESIRFAFDMLEEAGVKVEFYDGQVMNPGEYLRFNGEPVHY